MLSSMDREMERDAVPPHDPGESESVAAGRRAWEPIGRIVDGPPPVAKV
jgi:hypothetical protein